MKYLVGILPFLLWIALVSSRDGGRGCRCPDGWVEYGKSCYYFSRDIFIMPVASEVCRSMNGELVEINTSEENDYIWEQIKLRKLPYVFIGATDMREEHIWRWYRSNRMLQFTNWSPVDPNTPSFNCAHMYIVNGKWYDDPCYSVRHFVCEQWKSAKC